MIKNLLPDLTGHQTQCEQRLVGKGASLDKCIEDISYLANEMTIFGQ